MVCRGPSPQLSLSSGTMWVNSQWVKHKQTLIRNSPILFGTEWHDCPFQKEVQTGDIHHRNLNLKTESAQHASLHPKFRWLLQKFWGAAVPGITGVQPNPQTWVDQVSGTSVQRRLQCEVRILPLVDGGKPAARSTGIPKKNKKTPVKRICLQNSPFFWGDSEATTVYYQAADMLHSFDTLGMMSKAGLTVGNPSIY